MLEALREAYWTAIEGQATAATEDRDLYVKLAIVLLAAGRAFDADDGRRLGEVASAAKRVLEDLGVDLTPKYVAEDGRTDPDNAGGALVPSKDFARRVEERVKELLAELEEDITRIDVIGERLARLVRSGPWATICRARCDQREDGTRVAAALRSLQDLELVPAVRAALEALGATKDESKAATRQLK